ncbi:MAG TPA: ABC transporter permease, partial [Blastocatellia bacterium]|nr:ABC transporter permease [Blastocatellia bacterium]
MDEEIQSNIRRLLAESSLDPIHRAEIVEEVCQHLEDRYRELRAAGAAEVEAGRIVFGELSHIEMLTREVRRAERKFGPEPAILGAPGRGMMISDLWQDLQFAVRTFRKQPSFTVIALMTLALGIGANTAIFSVINSVLLRPLPFPESERLVIVQGNFVALNATRMRLSVPEYADVREQTSSFAATGVIDNVSVNLAGYEGGEPERVEGAALTPEMFAVLKVAPMLGRSFDSEEAQEGRDDVVLLSYGFWQRRFAGNDNAVGQKLTINGRSHTIIGVMPPGFAFPRQAQIWQPLWFPKASYDQQRRGARGLEVLARLKAEASLPAAQAELDRLSAQLTEQYPQNYAAERRYRMTLTPLLEDHVGEVRPSLLLLLGAVGFVLLIACANVANLLLARAAARRQEIAVRLAMGAGRGRILRQLMAESVLLAAAGGAAGLVFAVWGTRLLLDVAPHNLPRMAEVGLDSRVLIFTALASMLTGILFGLVPAWVSSRADVNQALRESGRAGTGARQLRLLNIFVVVEVALALVLLTGAGLAMKSFWRLHSVEPGFNADGVLTLRMLLPMNTHPQRPQRAAFFREVLERMRALPGVTGAGAVSLIP